MGEILVRGHAEARLPPTDAAVVVVVQSRAGGSQREAVSLCAQRSAEVDGLVDVRRGGLVRRTLTSSVRTGPEYDHTAKAGRRLVGYVATRTTELDCAPDGDGLTGLVGDLAGLVDVRVDGPRWRVGPESEGWAALRTDAAADARRRAAAYAAGLGVSVGRVLWAAEPGLRLAGDGPSGMPAAASPMMARAGQPEADAEPTPVRIVPEPVTVSVTVEVGFDVS